MLKVTMTRKLVRTLLMTVWVPALVSMAGAQVSTTTVQGTVYRADGKPASGSVIVTWPAFATARGEAVAAGSVTAAVGQDGFISLSLAPNLGSTPAGSYYTAVYHLNDGTVSREYWVVPSSGTATMASVRAQLEPSTVAVQSATKQYVDSSVASITSSYLPISGGVMNGPLLLSSDPTSGSQAATKHYTDGATATLVQRGGDQMTGALLLPNEIGKMPRVDVRHPDFAGGADPTGTSDSTAAFQAAIAYALAHPQQAGGINYPAVYCAPGRYKISGTLRIPNSMHFYGDGAMSCDLVETSPRANLITVYSAARLFLSGVYPGSIEGVTLEGSGHSTTGTLLEINDADSYSLENVQFYNHGGRALQLNAAAERFSTRNLYFDAVRWPIIMAADENESYFFNTQILGPGATNEPVSTTDKYCYNVNCVAGVYPGPNQGPSGSATPISPDQHAAVYIAKAVNFRFLGGSIKPLKYLAGFHVFAGDVANISNFYCEGFPSDSAPRLNACVIAGGTAEMTTLAGALSATGTTVAVANTAWLPEYYNDPADIPFNSLEQSKPYVIMPKDYLSGSTAASAYVPGLQRGQYEMVDALGASSDGNLYLRLRNQPGSTAPAGTAWPAGSILEKQTQANGFQGALSIDQTHITAMQGPQTGYVDNCDQTGPLTCAEMILGFTPDGYWIDGPGGANPNTAGLSVNVILNGDALGAGAYTHKGEIATHSISFITINGQANASAGETSEVAASTNQKFSIGRATGGSYVTAPVYAGNISAAAVVSVPSSRASWASSLQRGFPNVFAQEARQFGQGGFGSGGWMNGTQFANQYCWFDVPATGTQSNGRLCLNGGPSNDRSLGFEYDVWNGTAWTNACSVTGASSGTAGLRVRGGLTAGAMNGEVTVDGVQYATLNAAWMAAAALAASTGQNQTVRLGPGTYPVTETMNEPANGACVNVVGSGGSGTGADMQQTATTLNATQSLAGDVFYAGNTAQVQNCTFKDLNVLAAKNATHGFEMQWVRGLLMDNVTVNDTTLEGILIGEANMSGGHQAGFLLRNVTVSYSSASFTPASRPAYGVHLAKTAMDGQLETVLVRNAQTAAVFNEGTGNTGYMVHGFGYPYTCTTGPCSNTASSSSAANASYATSYVIYDTGGSGTVWTDTYADSPATAAFYIGANGVTIHGGHVQWPELTSFPSANLAYVAATVTNGLTLSDIGCNGMASGVNWITYAATFGVPPAYASVHHLSGCGNYYQALDPASTLGLSSGGTNLSDSSGATPKLWVAPNSSSAKSGAFGAQYYSGFQGDLLQGHFSGGGPFFNVTYQGTVRSAGGIALSTVTNTAAALTLTDANRTVLANASGGAQTITLTDCGAAMADGAARTGQEFNVVKTDTSANVVTVAGTAGQTVNYNGAVAGTLAITTAGTRTLVCGPDRNWYAH